MSVCGSQNTFNTFSHQINYNFQVLVDDAKMLRWMQSDEVVCLEKHFNDEQLSMRIESEWREKSSQGLIMLMTRKINSKWWTSIHKDRHVNPHKHSNLCFMKIHAIKFQFFWCKIDLNSFLVCPWAREIWEWFEILLCIYDRANNF